MGFSTDCLKCCSYSILLLVLLGIGIGLSITSIVLGTININSNCTGYSQIPAYLITTGVLGVIAFLVGFSDNLDKEKKDDSCFLQLIYLAHFGVVIWGAVILFGKDRPNCDRVLFDYAYAITLTTYVIVAIFILFYCCSCFVVLYDGKDKSRKLSNQTNLTNQTNSTNNIVIEMNQSNV